LSDSSLFYGPEHITQNSTMLLVSDSSSTSATFFS